MKKLIIVFVVVLIILLAQIVLGEENKNVSPIGKNFSNVGQRFQGSRNQIMLKPTPEMIEKFKKMREQNLRINKGRKILGDRGNRHQMMDRERRNIYQMRDKGMRGPQMMRNRGRGFQNRGRGFQNRGRGFQNRGREERGHRVIRSRGFQIKRRNRIKK